MDDQLPNPTDDRSGAVIWLAVIFFCALGFVPGFVLGVIVSAWT